ATKLSPQHQSIDAYQAEGIANLIEGAVATSTRTPIDLELYSATGKQPSSCPLVRRRQLALQDLLELRSASAPPPHRMLAMIPCKYCSISSLLENTRTQEKEQLTGLNSRLATYIDKVRQLEAENSRLTVQIKDIEIIEKKERNNLAERFEAER
ncbi:hypothetical protein OSTOST_14212, partial [Ostertagia ostertagi]